MGVIAGSPKKDAEGTAIMYAHDRGTVAAGKWLILSSLALLVIFVVGGMANLLPDQGAAELKVVQAGRYEDYFEKPEEAQTPYDLPWITVEVPVQPDQFGGRIPQQFTMLAQSPDGWEPARAQLFRVTPDRWKERILYYPVVDAGKSPAEVEVNVPISDESYMLELYIQPVRNDRAAFNDLEGAKRQAKLESLKTNRDTIIDAIKKTGAVRVALKP